MRPSGSQWFEMPSPFGDGTQRLFLLEPPTACAGELRCRLLDETYGRPYVVDDGDWRYLHFDQRLVQSAMRLAAPNALEVRYTQKMMSCLLFRPQPRRIVLIGLGGGSLAKFCHVRLPAAQVCVVESNRDVIALRDAFQVPADGPRFEVVEADGAAYLAGAGKGIDLLLVDAFDRHGFADSLATEAFFGQAGAKLAGGGVLAVNLAGDKQRYVGVVATAMQVFDDRCILLPVREDDNRVLLAFNDAAFQPDWRRLRNRARELRARHGLDFPAFLALIERSVKRDLAGREAGHGR